MFVTTAASLAAVLKNVVELDSPMSSCLLVSDLTILQELDERRATYA